MHSCSPLPPLQRRHSHENNFSPIRKLSNLKYVGIKGLWCEGRGAPDTALVAININKIKIQLYIKSQRQ